MAQIELREHIIGGGYSGHIDAPVGLSWSDRTLIASIGDRIGSVGFTIGSVGMAITGFERTVGLGLDRQLAVLSRQIDLLQEIAQSLRTPAKSRAAERVLAASELLSRERWQRALDAAAAAIEDDPNNPGTFLAAAWAKIGMKDPEGALPLLIEAAEASDGLDGSSAGRQAARIAFVVTDTSEAVALLDRFALGDPGPDPDLGAGIDDGHDRAAGVAREDWSRHASEYAAVLIDRAVYNTDLGELDAARESLRAVIGFDARALFFALGDPILAREASMPSFVVELVEETRRGLARVAEAARARLDRARADLGRHVSVKPYCATLVDRLDELVERWRAVSIETGAELRATTHQLMAEIAEALERADDEDESDRAAAIELETGAAAERRRAALELAEQWARKRAASVYVGCDIPGPDYGSGESRILILKTGVFNNHAWFVFDEPEAPLEVRRWSGESQEFWRQARRLGRSQRDLH